MSAKPVLYYFGCIREAGHYLWQSDSSKYYARQMAAKVPGLNWRVLECIDAVYTPRFPDGAETEGFYQESIVPPVRIVAWWDRSVDDDRGGCNSNLIGYGYANGEAMLDAAMSIFPSVMNRQPRPQRIQIPPDELGFTRGRLSQLPTIDHLKSRIAELDETVSLLQNTLREVMK